MHKEIISRRQAHLLGLDRYFTGEPCKKGHIAARYMKGGGCIECAGGSERLSSLDYIQSLELKKKKKMDELKEWMESLVAWRQESPAARRYRKIIENGGSYTEEDIQFLMEVQKGKCAHAWCRVNLKNGYEVDHVIPVVLGGRSDRKNLQLLCTPCNRSKRANHPIDFAQKHGMLL